MQQASSSNGKTSPNNGSFLPTPASATSGSPRFVVNLCASTTPVGLVQPTHAGLKRFTFFVSRRLEEGRERFRLHMGYFETQEEAEKILDLVRDVYPAAWAGVAPGIKLRSRGLADAPATPAPRADAAQAAAVQQAAAAAPAVEAAAAAAAAAGPAPPPPPMAASGRAISAAVPQIPPALAPAPVAPLESVPAAAPVVAPVVAPVKLELVPDSPRATAAPAETAAPSHADSGAAAQSLDNIRATIDSLDDEEPPAIPAAARAEPLDAPAVLRVLESAAPASPPRVVPTLSSARAPAPSSGQPAAAATPRRAVAAPRAGAATPPQSEPALFAVQLLWSVQSIDMKQVPQLAIFSAYTLYGAEGNRDGRRWYGLRLGFFTDAVSAKQVAQYVRSEFNSVSVVPVSQRERERAGAATAKPMPAVANTKPAGVELNFIEDVQTDTATSGSRPALQDGEAAAAGDGGAGNNARARAAAAVGMTSRATPGKRAKLRVAQGMKPAPKRPTDGRPLSLEETLEVLGAGQLQIDDGRAALLSDSAVRERKPEPRSGSRFGRLINRLAERLGNG